MYTPGRFRFKIKVQKHHGDRQLLSEVKGHCRLQYMYLDSQPLSSQEIGPRSGHPGWLGY